MVMDYQVTDMAREDDVCPMCSSDLVIRIDGAVVFILCVNCYFSQCSAY